LMRVWSTLWRSQSKNEGFIRPARPPNRLKRVGLHSMQAVTVTAAATREPMTSDGIKESFVRPMCAHSLMVDAVSGPFSNACAPREYGRGRTQ
jgi:hypothetical protein